MHVADTISPEVAAGFPPALLADTVETVAWTVWQAAYELAAAKGITARPAQPLLEEGWGVEGYRVSVAFSSLLRDLYPDARTLGPANMSRWTQPIYAFLRASCNAKCLDPDATPPVWWIRAQWQDAVGVPIFRHLQPLPSRAPAVELTAREKRLTPTEAGEDRPPAPIETRPAVPPVVAGQCPDCRQRFRDLRSLQAHRLAKHTQIEVFTCPEAGCGRQVKGAGPFALHQAAHSRFRAMAEREAVQGAAVAAGFGAIEAAVGQMVTAAVAEATAGLRAELAEVRAERDSLAERLAALRKALDA